TTDVHKVNLWLVEKEVVMQCSYLQTFIQCHTHHGVHFILKKNHVPHDHGFALHTGGESSPGSESHKRSHTGLLNGDSDIILGLTDFKGILLFVERGLKAGDGFDLCRIQDIFSGETNRSGLKEQSGTETGGTEHHNQRER